MRKIDIQHFEYEIAQELNNMAQKEITHYLKEHCTLKEREEITKELLKIKEIKENEKHSIKEN